MTSRATNSALYKAHILSNRYIYIYVCKTLSVDSACWLYAKVFCRSSILYNVGSRERTRDKAMSSTTARAARARAFAV